MIANNHSIHPDEEAFLSSINRDNLFLEPMSSTFDEFSLSSVDRTSLDSPDGFSCVVKYPSKWLRNNKKFITPSDPYAQNDQTIIYLFGQFKATCSIEGRHIEETSNLFSFNEKNGRFESLAFISLLSATDNEPFTRFKLQPEENHNKFSIVKHILSNKNSTQNLNPTQLFFFITAQQGGRDLGVTNSIEISSQNNKNYAENKEKRLQREKDQSAQLPLNTTGSPKITVNLDNFKIPQNEIAQMLIDNFIQRISKKAIKQGIKEIDEESQQFIKTSVQQIKEHIEKKFLDLEEEIKQRQGDLSTHKRCLDSEKSQLDESSKKRRVDEPDVEKLSENSLLEELLSPTTIENSSSQSPPFSPSDFH